MKVPANQIIRCKNCAEPIVHDTFDWVHVDGYYMCDGSTEKAAER